MVARISLLAAALASVVSAGPCKPVVPTLPTVGGAGPELPSPPTTVTVKKIAVGHGIQNYTCATADTTTVAANGALAVLYDVTALYPGMPRTGLSQADWDSLTSSVLFGQDIPLNLMNTSANNPGTPTAPNALPESAYLANVDSPFIAKADLSIAGLPTLPFLGHHYFDKDNSPTFDLTEANLLGVVARANGTNAPTGANKGVIGTGAVPWLLLHNDLGTSRGVEYVYRVITAGGAAQACAVSGAGKGSVPYTAFYWFLG